MGANCNANSFTRQCGRTFSIHKIPHSNLVLLVIDTTCKCETRRLSVDPQEVFINESLRCERPQESLFRLRPSTCKSYHPEEEAIKLCGRGSVPVPSVAVSILLTVSLSTIQFQVERWSLHLEIFILINIKLEITDVSFCLVHSLKSLSLFQTFVFYFSIFDFSIFDLV